MEIMVRFQKSELGKRYENHRRPFGKKKLRDLQSSNTEVVKKKEHMKVNE